MMAQSGSPVGVCVAGTQPQNVARTCENAEYIHEILAHAGLYYRTIDPAELVASLPSLRVLVTVGEVLLGEDEQGALDEWVGDGNAWIAVAGVCGLCEVLGVDVEQPYVTTWGGGVMSLGEGYLETHKGAHPVLNGLWRPLHYFGGLAVIPAGAEVLAFALDAHQGIASSADNPIRAALTERPVGTGLAMFIAPDIPGAVVRIQQGVAVTRDGVSAPDGSGPRTDGVLKSDDGVVLDWLHDRGPVPGIPGFHAFLDPVADQWCMLLVRSIFHAARTLGVSLPVLWLYPRNLPAIAELSHDTDGCEEAKAHTLLSVLSEEKVKSTWCVLLPGYKPETIDAIRDAGHELGMHFDAMSDGSAWTEQEFGAQKTALQAIIGSVPATNKNHYLRWEGDTEFFEWCVRSGIRLDQSKGASKTGEAGFLFGTCHPYRPMTPAGDVLDVFELPTPTQDLIIFCPKELSTPLLQAVAKVHGVLHLLFHPAHIDSPGVAVSLRQAVAAARDIGMEFWTAREIAEWEGARRTVRWSAEEGPGGSTMTVLSAAEALPDATVLWLDIGATPVLTVDGDDYPGVLVERWGFRFVAATFDIEAGRKHVLEGPR